MQEKSASHTLAAERALEPLFGQESPLFPTDW